MKPLRLWIYKLLTGWMPESRCFGLKCSLLRWAGVKIGRNVRIYSSATFSGTGKIVIGEDVHIGAGAQISAVMPHEIMLGSHIDIGPQVMIITGSHKVNPSDDPKDSSDYLCTHMAGEGAGGSVIIADGCWLGARSTILPGVTLPRKTMVAAGSVVTKSPDCCEKCLLAGLPAKVRKCYGVVEGICNA